MCFHKCKHLIEQDCCSAILFTHTDALSLFIRAGNHWRVNDQLGKESSGLRAEVGEANQPPVKGWMFYTGSEWSSEDETLECSRQLSAACEEITVELEGEAMERHPECAGVYRPLKGEYNRGRKVGSFNQS